MLSRVIYNRELHKDDISELLRITVGLGQLERVENLLEEMRMDYWQGDEASNRFHCLTQAVQDEIEGRLVLVIYAVRVTGDGFTKEGWEKCYADLAQYATKLGCSCMVAYTENSRVMRIGKLLGGKTKAFIQFPIDGGRNGRLLE